MFDFQPFYDALARLEGMIGDTNQRIASMHTHGTVAEVDAQKHRVRLQIGVDAEGAPVLSAPVPYMQWAGAMKDHWTPSVGQQMTMVAPDGTRDAANYALPLTWSDANPSPSQNADEGVQTFGDMKITKKGDLVNITVGASSFEVSKTGITLTTSGALTLKAGSVAFLKQG